MVFAKLTGSNLRPTIQAAIGGAVLVTGLGMVPAPAFAQDEDARVRKLEAEVRALQRVVFPGGDNRYFTPEVTSETQRGQQGGQATITYPQQGPASTTAVTDILARLDALEGQLARLTARTEENDNMLRQMGTRLDALEAVRSAPVTATPAPSSASTPTPTAVVPATTVAATTATPTPAADPTPERVAAVQAIAKPQTDDAADDEYSYGFRLWDAGFYPEAQQQLRMFVDRYPSHWRATYGRNLLGRAYLDNGQPREAATWFLQNYNSDKTADRAPDSLLYLAEAMIALDDDRRACIALAEFGETYPALAAGRLQAQYDANRGKVTCS